eukprot:1140869-Pelagomonas_calceolata.AAC.3
MEGGASYVNISELLGRVRQDLPLGEMVHTDSFSLFEAMSAVELGNIKMDAAMSTSCKSVEELIQEGVAPVEGLTPGQILLIMERLLMMEVSAQEPRKPPCKIFYQPNVPLCLNASAHACTSNVRLEAYRPQHNSR